MTNKIIIDGWNVAWKIAEIRKHIPEDLHKARTIFNSRVKSYFYGKKSVYKVIYDGKSGIMSEDDYVRGIDIRFSQNPEKADHLIIKYLIRQKNARQWTVVTSDRSLSAHVRSLGAYVISSESFIQKITSAESDFPTHFKHNPQLGNDEMKFWLDQFSADEEKDEK
jgi:predicted RNA-binding protein with PIN domain